MIKNKLKKYRAIGIIAGAMGFNLIESIVFAQNGKPFNLKPLSIGEWICDIISTLGFIFGAMMAIYDLCDYRPKKTTVFKVSNNKIVEIKEEQ